jgi:hypothetical protein
MRQPKWYEGLEYKDMTPEQRKEYKKCKWEIISNYMGVPVTSADSLRLRTQAFLEETRSTSIWD